MEAADPAVVKAMVAGGIKPDRLIANAFQELARNSAKIGNLNDVLIELMVATASSKILSSSIPVPE